MIFPCNDGLAKKGPWVIEPCFEKARPLAWAYNEPELTSSVTMIEQSITLTAFALINNNSGQQRPSA